MLNCFVFVFYNFLGLLALLLTPPDEKNGKTNSFGGIWGVFWQGFGGYLEVCLGGCWKVFVSVFERFLGVI